MSEGEREGGREVGVDGVKFYLTNQTSHSIRRISLAVTYPLLSRRLSSMESFNAIDAFMPDLIVDTALRNNCKLFISVLM